MTRTPPTAAVLAAGTMGAALLAAGCSSGGSSTGTSATASPTLPTPTVTVTTGPTPTPTETTKATLPRPPAGTTKLGAHFTSSAQYARYKNSSEKPRQVVNYYAGQARSEGYSVKSQGGGGGGWGGYGGSDFGMAAVKSNAYLSVHAGASKQTPTFFEVCVGSEKSALKACDRHSESDSRSSGS